MPIPKPLTAGRLCAACRGTGADIEATLARDAREPDAAGYIRCHTCNGNGLDPAEYFTWTSTLKEQRMIHAHRAGRDAYHADPRTLVVPAYYTDADERDAFTAGYRGEERRTTNGGI